MPWWQTIPPTFTNRLALEYQTTAPKKKPPSSSSSSSSSSAPAAVVSPPSPSPDAASSSAVTGYQRRGFRPSLKKLRQFTELDLGASRKRFTSAGSSPENTPISLSSSSLENLSKRVLGRPQPLPLPDLLRPVRRDGVSSPNFRKPSSKGALSVLSPEARERDRDGSNRSDAISGDGNGRYAYQEVHKSPQKSPTKSPQKSPTKSSQRSPQKRPEGGTSSRRLPFDLKRQDSMRENYWRNVPVQSAPSSPFSRSPALSPPRPSMADIFQPHYMAMQGFQVWSAPELPTFDMALGYPSQTSPDRTTISLDSSPLHSPTSRSPTHYPKSPSGPTSPLHPLLSMDATPRRESNVHPLPLPPGFALPSQVTAKPESLSMTSQWQKGKLIGRGTFGSVYVATNRETGALCAMKEVEILPDDPKSAECMKQLQQEIKFLSQLKHPNIVQYYGSEIVEDKFYIYLEYVYPGSINKYVREHCGAITESVVRNFTRHILSGLAYLHNTKTIHRDIKGANLLVDATGVVKLADFGMAKHLSGQSADLSLKGSPYWMAPEVLQAVMHKDNSSDLAFAIDIWSLGCTIIEMLKGKPPWSEYEGAAAMFKVMRETPPVPEMLSWEGKDFLRCCFRRNPAERPPANKLLDHPFLRNALSPDATSCAQAFNGLSLEHTHSLKEPSNLKLSRLISQSRKGAKAKATTKSFNSIRNYLGVAGNNELRLPT